MRETLSSAIKKALGIKSPSSAMHSRKANEAVLEGVADATRETGSSCNINYERMSECAAKIIDIVNSIDHKLGTSSTKEERAIAVRQRADEMGLYDDVNESEFLMAMIIASFEVFGRVSDEPR